MKTARHRAACRPASPLSTFGHAVTGKAGRRAIVAAASSGVILSLTASGAIASPGAVGSELHSVDLGAVATSNDTVNTAATVTVSADVKWSLGSTTKVESEAPPEPEPEPEPAPVATYQRTTTETSRSAERTPAPASTESESSKSSSDSSTATKAPSSSASGIRAKIVDIAFRYVGTPYVYGGSTPKAFDCSGFTSYVYAQVGISLPRSSSAQRGAGTVVSASEAQPGDLVWWPGHVGIYLGGNQHIAARQPGTPLHASQIWRSNPTFIRVVG